MNHCQLRAGDCERPRERLFALGGDRVSDDELVAVVLGTGSPGRSVLRLARDLLAHVGGISALARAAPHELVALPGIGACKAARVVAAFQLGRRAIEVAVSPATGIRSADEVFTRLRPRMIGLAQEIFVVLALDIRNVIIDEVEVARGCLTGVDVHPREVFRPLIRQSAAACVVAHNHPSGDPQPSADDMALTLRLREVGELVGIPVLDHLVIGGDGYTSIADLLGAG